jgi:hypothetical protein
MQRIYLVNAYMQNHPSKPVKGFNFPIRLIFKPKTNTEITPLNIQSSNGPITSKQV